MSDSSIGNLALDKALINGLKLLMHKNHEALKTIPVSSCVDVDVLQSFPADCNPFHHDIYHMGTPIKTPNGDLWVMYDSVASYIILVLPNGHRLRINFDLE